LRIQAWGGKKLRKIQLRKRIVTEPIAEQRDMQYLSLDDEGVMAAAKAQSPYQD